MANNLNTTKEQERTELHRAINIDRNFFIPRTIRIQTAHITITTKNDMAIPDTSGSLMLWDGSGGNPRPVLFLPIYTLPKI
jgi:hypothetical protein